MDLSQQLDRFKQQQQRCHASLSIINATRAPSKPQQYAPAPRPPMAKPSAPAPAVRFSDDTARLQKMHAVRKSAVGSQMKDVIELLYRTRKALTATQINDATYVDIAGNSAVFESLRNNPKVRFDGRFFSYKPTHNVTGKDGLLALIADFRDGIPVKELEDAYPTVLDDLQALKSSGDIYLLPGEQDMVFPNDSRSRLELDTELKKLFYEIKLPKDMLDIEKDLRRNGEKPMTDTAKRRAAAEIFGKPSKPKKSKKKQRGMTSRTRITNIHLPGLFELPMDTKDFI
ncbi:transcription initiation factor IIE subunit beta [Lolium perenne]|uniref:transcription initiation factor IIE subunit beta n=1 Tax=Lolium perenne TaxID=4522 RepID=UPI0021EAB7FF|nr:uncharacterized protein LOC127338080 [Lolium perenne]